MEPGATLNEVNRILKPSGIFAAFNNNWPPFVNFQCDTVYQNLLREVRTLLAQHTESLPRETQYPKENHLDNIRRSTHFQWCTELHLTNKQACDRERFVNLAMSQGGLQTLRKNGIEAIEQHIAVFEREAETIFSRLGETTMWTHYRIRLGMKG